MNTTREIIDAICCAQNIVITAHIRPDGDAIGACLGLHRILKNAGLKTTIVDLAPLPERYIFMVKEGECLSSEAFNFSEIDLIIVLDSGSPDRCAEFVTKLSKTKTIINIDHHISNTKFGTLNYVDPTASSVGEILCKIAQSAEFEITPEAAEALWVSIVTDTGRFSYSNTTPATMDAAAKLLATGIDTSDLNHRIYNIAPLRQIKLKGQAINNLSTHEDGKLAMITLSQEELSAFGCTSADTEDIVNIPRNIAGVSVALFLYEMPDKDETKVSLRTAEPYDAAELCRSLGGGGHARAAGCSLQGRLPTTRTKILEIIHNQWFSE